MGKVLVIGATGMVGQAVSKAASAREHDVTGAARSGAGETLDILDDAAVVALFERLRPDVAVNCAAIVSHEGCERDPAVACLVNGRAVAVIAEAAARAGTRLVHVSTDQYWIGDGRAKHAEDAPVRLVNEYARSKYAGEGFARAYANTLTVRTNVTGFRGLDGRPTFVEWVIGALRAGEDMTLFDDFFTSTLDATALAEAILDLVDGGQTGLLNVASSQVSSKQEFIEAMARELGVRDREFATASVRGIDPPRAESLGLDVSAAERALGRPLPDLKETVAALVAGAP
jgi:dTDP-4-dehydrorhamnose reductase